MTKIRQARSFTDYLRYLRCLRHPPGEKDASGYRSFLSLSNHNIPGIYVLDYTSGKYLFTNERLGQIIGYSSAYIREAGIEFTTGICHPGDLKVFDQKIFPATLEFFSRLPPSACTDFIISCNYRMRTRQGNYAHILQQSVIVQSDTRNRPLIAIGSVSDISAYSPGSRIVHTIQPKNSVSTGNPLPGLENIWFSDEEDEILSKRETEILKMVCEGMESREIALQLTVSHHTVNNHRRNILRKTNSKNTLDLMKFALKARLVK